MSRIGAAKQLPNRVVGWSDYDPTGQFYKGPFDSNGVPAAAVAYQTTSKTLAEVQADFYGKQQIPANMEGYVNSAGQAIHSYIPDMGKYSHYDPNYVPPRKATSMLPIFLIGTAIFAYMARRKRA
jgi:hypothetical protein